MLCTKIQNELPLYFGKEINFWRRFVIGRHLRACEQCREELAKYHNSKKLFAMAFDETMPEVSDELFWQQLQAKLPTNNTAVQKISFARRPAFQKLRPILIPALATLLIFFLWKFVPDNAHDSRFSQKEMISETNPQTVPIIEDVKMPGTTPLVFQTDDPKIKIVWFIKNVPES